MSSDAIVILRNDHQEIRRLFRFAAIGDDATESLPVHTYEEEHDWFPTVRAGPGRKKLSELGEQMVEQKKTAPRSPAQPSALKKAVDALNSRGGSGPEGMAGPFGGSPFRPALLNRLRGELDELA